MQKSFGIRPGWDVLLYRRHIPAYSHPARSAGAGEVARSDPGVPRAVAVRDRRVGAAGRSPSRGVDVAAGRRRLLAALGADQERVQPGVAARAGGGSRASRRTDASAYGSRILGAPHSRPIRPARAPGLHPFQPGVARAVRVPARVAVHVVSSVAAPVFVRPRGQSRRHRCRSGPRAGWIDARAGLRGRSGFRASAPTTLGTIGGRRTHLIPHAARTRQMTRHAIRGTLRHSAWSEPRVVRGQLAGVSRPARSGSWC